jgi:hypothetical protein
MAVTSIWPITVRLNSVIKYACNPEKTTQEAREETSQLHKINDVVQYTANDMKTEQREFVSGINCNEAHAADDFMTTKKHWDKTDGRICYHGYQSFAKGETTAETAHIIGVELAKRIWGERFEVLVATHCNTGCYHNHFVINSVSFLDGYKFYNSPADYQKMRDESDRLCIEYGLSVIPNPHGRGKNYSEWQAEKNGKPVIRGTIRQDIDNAITASADGKEFIRNMEEKGYEFKFTSAKGTKLKWPSVKPPDSPYYYRLERLGPQYGMGAILNRIDDRPYRDVPFPESDRKAVSRLRRSYRSEIDKRNATGIYALYLRYCYELRIFQRYPASAKRVSFFMREDLTKLSKLDAQTLFLGRTGIKTIDELTAYKDSAAAQIETLTVERTMLRNEMRRRLRQNAYGVANEIKAKITGISAQITQLRKEIDLCEGIEERSGRIVRELEEIEKAQENEGKENPDNELLRRRGRTGH